MKTITKKYKVYSFDELSENAKEKALNSLYDINVDYDWWDYVYEDAKMIGLSIEEFDIDRGSYCKGSLTKDITDVLKAIFGNHGEKTETYKLAKEYEKKLNDFEHTEKHKIIDEYEQEQARDEIAEEFLHDLCEEYRVILQKEYEYMISEEAIIETIESNEYTFLEDGKMFNS